MFLLLLYVGLALTVSFLCSILEATLLSITPAFVAAQERKGAASSQRLKKLKADVDRPLAAILSLNTIANTVGAAGAGAQATVVFGDAYLGVASGVLTLLILLFSEIIPKTVGALYWRNLIPLVTSVLPTIMILTWPLVKLAKGITYLLSRNRKEAPVSRDEISALADLGTQQGVFEQEESRILKSLLRFSSLRVSDIMTPRTVVYLLPESTTVEETMVTPDLRFSRIPIYRKDRDDVTGYVLKDDILFHAAQEEDDVPLSALCREFLMVPEALPLPELFARLLEKVQHIALVLDEYGGMAGIVTMEDVVETLLGLEIVDEADTTQDMQELARQQWTRRATRLGLIQETAEANARQREAVARSGLTGGSPPEVT